MSGCAELAEDTIESAFRGQTAAGGGLGKAATVSGSAFIHAMIAVNIVDQAVLGVLGAEIWSREPGQYGSACRQRRNAN